MDLHFNDLRPLTVGLPPITLLSSTDYNGAGRAALQLFQSLRMLGMDVSMLVLEHKSYTDGITPILVNSKSAKTLYTGLHASSLRRYPKRPYGYEVFWSNKSAVNLAEYENVRRAGLLHVHAIPGLLAFPQASTVLREKALVWTQHSMENFTGGCTCTAGCTQFIHNGCSQCPQLGIPSEQNTDLAAWNFTAKREGYANLNVHVVSPSRWLGDCARQSLLLGSFPQTIIPHAVDTKTFSPMRQTRARAALGLPTDGKIIAFSASNNGRRNKGFHVLAQALELLRSQQFSKQALLLILGDSYGETSLPGYECRALGFIEDKTKLATAYSAADVFVTPSFQEAFGLVTTEAQACGTPCIGFYGTGAEDIIQDGITGSLAKHPGLPLANGNIPSHDDAYHSIKPECIDDLAAKIEHILTMPSEDYEAMRRACREHAFIEYSEELEAARYIQLYRRVLGLPDVMLPEISATL